MYAGFSRKPASKKFCLHVCGAISEDEVCRDYGITAIHLNTPWFHLYFPYWPTKWWPNVDLTKKFDFSRTTTTRRSPSPKAEAPTPDTAD